MCFSFSRKTLFLSLGYLNLFQVIFNISITFQLLSFYLGRFKPSPFFRSPSWYSYEWVCYFFSYQEWNISHHLDLWGITSLYIFVRCYILHKMVNCLGITQWRFTAEICRYVTKCCVKIKHSLPCPSFIIILSQSWTGYNSFMIVHWTEKMIGCGGITLNSPFSLCHVSIIQIADPKTDLWGILEETQQFWIIRSHFLPCPSEYWVMVFSSDAFFLFYTISIIITLHLFTLLSWWVDCDIFHCLLAENVFITTLPFKITTPPLMSVTLLFCTHLVFF